MENAKGPNQPEFPVGSLVRIVKKPELETFFVEWKLHRPLVLTQFAYAGIVAEVVLVEFFVGDDEVYTLKGVPGFWHKVCLERVR